MPQHTARPRQASTPTFNVRPHRRMPRYADSHVPPAGHDRRFESDLTAARRRQREWECSIGLAERSAA